MTSIEKRILDEMDTEETLRRVDAKLAAQDRAEQAQLRHRLMAMSLEERAEYDRRLIRAKNARVLGVSAVILATGAVLGLSYWSGGFKGVGLTIATILMAGSLAGITIGAVRTSSALLVGSVAICFVSWWLGVP
jgi:hypothetical protein